MLIYNLMFRQSPLSSVFSKICQPNPGLPLTHHRRVASSFRDPSLFQIFQISLTSLRQLKNDGNMQGFWWFWSFENTMHFDLFPSTYSDFVFPSAGFSILSCSFEHVKATCHFSFIEVFVLWFCWDFPRWKFWRVRYSAGITLKFNL